MSFGMGDVKLLFFALLVFSFIMSLSLITGYQYSILTDEIRSLKKSIGYKLGNEISISNLKNIIKN